MGLHAVSHCCAGARHRGGAPFLHALCSAAPRGAAHPIGLISTCSVINSSVISTASLGPRGTIAAHYNAVDGHGVPVPHCGVVLEMDDWQSLADRLKRHQVKFVIEPYIRFKGQPGEQATLFFLDPSGNALEFKAFKDIDGQLFATR